MCCALSVRAHAVPRAGFTQRLPLWCVNSAGATPELCVTPVPLPGHPADAAGEAVHPQHRPLRAGAGGAVQPGQDPPAARGGAHCTGEQSPPCIPQPCRGTLSPENRGQ